jgi:hypothetical protein
MKIPPMPSQASEQTKKVFSIRRGMVILFLLLVLIAPPTIRSRWQARAATASTWPVGRSERELRVQQTEEPLHWSDPLKTFLAAYTFRDCYPSALGNQACIWNKPGTEPTDFWIEVRHFENMSECRAYQ